MSGKEIGRSGQEPQKEIGPSSSRQRTNTGSNTFDDADDGGATFVPDTTAVPNRAATSKRETMSTKSGDTADGSVPKDNPPKKSGTTSLGKYKLLKRLGKGGMGEVFLGEDTKLGRKAAIKVLSKALAGREDFVARFYKEARAMARVSHENAVSVYDVDQDQNIHFVAMEFIDGQSMQKWMDDKGTLSVGDAVHVTLRCAEALQFAHSQNLIHRDIKPDNIMLTSKGKVKVADFGLAKATDEDLSMTASGTGLGTPYYMAPEQARNAKHVDNRADIYALGVTFYYFLTGKLPFTGSSTVEVITAKDKGRFESARKLNPQVPDRLDLFLAKMMDKDPERRFKDCEEVIQVLRGFGLESPALSFIDGAVPVRSGPSSPHASQPTRVISATAAANAKSVSSGAPRTSSEDAAAQARQAATPATEGDQWIVQFKNQQGKETIARFTTPQILTAFKTGMLDVKAKLKKKPTDAFVPIGFYPEFEKAVEGRNIKEKAEQKSLGLKAEFAKIDRQYGRQNWVRFFRSFASGTAGVVQLILWLVFVFGGLAALVIYFPQIWNAFANSANSILKK